MDNKELNDLEALELSAEDLEDIAGGKLDKKFLSSTMAGITLLTGSPNFSNTKAASSSLSGSDFSTQISAKVEKEEKQENQEVKPKSETNVKESKSITEVDYDYDAKTGKLVINKGPHGCFGEFDLQIIFLYEHIQSNDIKKLEIKDGVLTLAEGCFKGLKNLESVELPDSLDTIGNYAFYGCSKLEKIFLPKRIRGIGREAIGASNVIMYDSKVWKFPYLNILEERAGFLDRICHKNTTVTIIDTGSGNIKELKKELKKVRKSHWILGLCTFGLEWIFDLLNLVRSGSVKINVISEKEFLKNKASYL